MVIESPNLLPNPTVAGKRVQVITLPTITRKTAERFFPAFGFDPVGGVAHGNVLTPPGAGEDWEQFTALNGSMMVPRHLTDLVRKRFPDCRWAMFGLRLYALLEGRVVAIINDGVMEGW